MMHNMVAVTMHEECPGTRMLNIHLDSLASITIDVPGGLNRKAELSSGFK
jgi:hypothetical protein